jgi:hypothetical protein
MELMDAKEESGQRLLPLDITPCRAVLPAIIAVFSVHRMVIILEARDHHWIARWCYTSIALQYPVCQWPEVMQDATGFPRCRCDLDHSTLLVAMHYR